RRYQQVAADYVTALRDSLLGLIQLGDKATAPFTVENPLLGQRQMASGPMQQLDTKPSLQGVYPAANHSRRDLLLECGLGEAATIHRRQECFDLGQSGH